MSAPTTNHTYPDASPHDLAVVLGDVAPVPAGEQPEHSRRPRPRLVTA